MTKETRFPQFYEDEGGVQNVGGRKFVPAPYADAFLEMLDHAIGKRIVSQADFVKLRSTIKNNNDVFTRVLAKKLKAEREARTALEQRLAVMEKTIKTLQGAPDADGSNLIQARSRITAALDVLEFGTIPNDIIPNVVEPDPEPTPAPTPAPPSFRTSREAQPVARKDIATGTIQKRATPSSTNKLRFILSDETPDRVGDIIMADGWDLSEFKRNPVALYGHDHAAVIGKWDKVHVKSGKLYGTLVLADEGTSDRINEVRGLLDQGLLKAVSVGFAPVKWEPIDPDDKYGHKGVRFLKQKLLEVSVVAVPANPAALAVGGE